jgi:sulfur-oxidizing protein SoxY
VSARDRTATDRRRLLHGAGGLALLLTCRPALAVSATDSLLTVVNRWAGGQPVREGRISFDIAPLVENGNVVPISIAVDSPMSAADHVREIVVFNERNPQRDVVRFTLSAASGRAQVDTRIRLATSQKLVALARMSDGSQWSRYVDVIVTLAACVEP